MPQSRRKNGRDQLVAAQRARGGVIIGAAAQPHRVHNAKGKVYPCVWADCWNDGDTRFQLWEPNPDAPSVHMPGGKIIRVFCSEKHRDLFVADAQQMRRDQADEQRRLRAARR